MKVIDLTKEQHNTYFCCLEEWSDEMKEAGDHKACWFEKFKDKGLRVKLALDDSGKACGMIQYIPIKESFVEGKDLFFILCIWVHGHKKGIGNVQGKGMGKALLKAAEEDAEALGAQGMAAWGLSLPFWMKASWFKKHGYKNADSQSMIKLVWKPFSNDASPPRWIRQRKAVDRIPGKVSVAAFINGWCPAMNIVYERAQKAAAEFGDKVVFQSFDTTDPDVFHEWGISDGVYIDGKKIGAGPPMPYKKLKKKIARKAAKIKETA